MSTTHLPPNLIAIFTTMTLAWLTGILTACQSMPTQNTHTQSTSTAPVLSSPKSPNKPYVIAEVTNDDINDDINNDINSNAGNTADHASVDSTQGTDLATLIDDPIFISPAKAESLAKSSPIYHTDGVDDPAISEQNSHTNNEIIRDKDMATTDAYQLTAPTITTPSNPTVASQNGDNFADYMIAEPSAQEMREALLNQARSNSSLNQADTHNKHHTQNDTPAFRHLMDTGVKQLQANQISQAEATFTRAQRLAPSSSAVYFYLSQVALKKRQPYKAEAMARRGLVVAEGNQRKRMLWQVILLSAQMRNDARLARQASDNLAKF